MARFAPSVQGPFVHVCAHNLPWLHCVYFEIIYPLVWLFPLCCSAFFSFCIFKISDAIILSGPFLHFVVCFNMYRAKLFVHLFACWFNCCDCMCVYLLALFFPVFFVVLNRFFPSALIKFTTNVFCRFCMLQLPRLFNLNSPQVPFF